MSLLIGTGIKFKLLVGPRIFAYPSDLICTILSLVLFGSHLTWNYLKFILFNILWFWKYYFFYLICFSYSSPSRPKMSSPIRHLSLWVRCPSHVPKDLLHSSLHMRCSTNCALSYRLWKPRVCGFSHISFVTSCVTSSKFLSLFSLTVKW